MDLSTCGYHVLNKLGEGAFGAVYLALTKDAQQEPVAIKMLLGPTQRSPTTNNIQVGIDNWIEIDILAKFKHPNLLNVLKILNPDKCQIDRVMLVLPLADMDLFNYIDTIGRNYTIANKLVLMKKIAFGLQTLHRFNILHLDIKPENILIKDDNPMLADFGYSFKVADVNNGVLTELNRISLDYRPFDTLRPVIVDDSGTELFFYNNKADIWSLGITYLVLINNEMVFDTRSITYLDAYLQKYAFLAATNTTDRLQRENFLRYKLRNILPNYINPVLVLINGMLQYDEKVRYNIDNVFYNPVFDGINLSTEGLEVNFAEPGLKTTIGATAMKKLLTQISTIALNFFAQENIELLFIAYDIFYHCIAHFQSQAEDFATVTVWIAWKYLTCPSAEKNRQFLNDLNSQKFPDIEIQILNILNGLINNCLIFDIARSKNDLLKYYNDYILSADQAIYFSVDIELYFAVLAENSPQEPSKFITIEEFYG